jgi:drug/metabolite transporter (DMT)-like permease
MSRSLRAHLILFFVVAVWGSTFVLVKAALQDVTPLLFNTLRMAIAFLCLAVLYRKEWSKITRSGWKSGLLVGLALAIAYHFQTSGLKLTTPSKSAFITGLTLVLVPLVSAIPGIRTAGSPLPTWNAWLGVAIAFAGVAFMTAPPAGNSWLPDLTGIGLGDLLTLGCAIAFSFHIIFQDRVSDKGTDRHEGREPIPFKQLALLQLGFCALLMAISTPLLERPHARFTPFVIAALIIESVLATALAFTVQSWVQQFLAPTYLVLIYALEPVFAWATSLLVLHQGLSVRSECGAALILIGVLTGEFLGPRPVK